MITPTFCGCDGCCCCCCCNGCGCGCCWCSGCWFCWLIWCIECCDPDDVDSILFDLSAGDQLELQCKSTAWWWQFCQSGSGRRWGRGSGLDEQVRAPRPWIEWWQMKVVEGDVELLIIFVPSWVIIMNHNQATRGSIICVDGKTGPGGDHWIGDQMVRGWWRRSLYCRRSR